MTGSDDNTVKIYNVCIPSKLLTLTVSSVTMTADSNFTVSGSGDSTVKI